ncbi:MAG: hypothetical protein ACRDKA_13705 [Actinomycetota bacterium]
MDPEALVLFTIEIGRNDPRLFDELMDWITLNGRYLSLQRIHNLTPNAPERKALVSAVVAWCAEHNPSLRWRARRRRSSRIEDVPVFSPRVLDYVGDPDPMFRQFGFLRPRAQRSGKSREPALADPVSFSLRMRAFFGPGTKPEILRFLLTSEELAAPVARIGQAIGYSKRNVNDALVSLADAGVVNARWRGNERVFNLSPGEWLNLLEIESPPRWVEWIPLLRALTVLAEWLAEPADAEESHYMRASRARGLVERIGGDLTSAGLELPDARDYPGPAYWEAFQVILGKVLVFLGLGQAATELVRSSPSPTEPEG